MEFLNLDMEGLQLSSRTKVALSLVSQLIKWIALACIVVVLFAGWCFTIGHAIYALAFFLGVEFLCVIVSLYLIIKSTNGEA